MVSIVQWNLNSVTQKVEELHCLSGTYRAKVLFLQETRLPPDLSFKFRNFSTYRKNVPAPNPSSMGSDVLEQRGGILESLLVHNLISVLDSGAPTHLDPHHGSLSAIDVSAASPPLLPFLSWVVLEDLHGSDYYPILISLEDHNLPPPYTRQLPRPPRWLLRRAKLDQFYLIMSSVHLPDLPLDEAVEYFTAALVETTSRSIPRLTSSHERPPVSWWSAECGAVTRAQRRANRKFHKYPTTSNREEKRICNNTARRTLRRHRKAQWFTFVSSLTAFTPAAEVWRKIRSILSKARSPPPPLSSDSPTEL
jgi:hypothetical protein